MAEELLPARLDLIIYRGDDFLKSLQFTDDEDEPINITGWTFLSQIRKTANDDELLAALTVTVTDAATGKLDLTLAASITKSLVTGVWDLEAVADGDTRTYLAGDAIVTSDVSRAV
jgi:hypothetical protein